MGELRAQRLPGVDAWELWNEQDGAEFWLGGPDPAAYAALLKATYPAIKAVQPDDIVVTGGTVGNDMDFIEALYAHGAKGSFDAVGVHTDTACLVDGPDFNYRDEQGRVGRYAFTGYREVHAVMARHGDGAKPIWMTELGWNTQSTAPGSCSVGMWAGQKPLGVTEAAAGRVPRARPTAASPPTRSSASRSGSACRTSRARRTRAATASTAPTARPSRPPPRSARSTAASRPQPCGGVIDTSGPQIQVAQPLDGLKFVDMFDVDAKARRLAPAASASARLEFYADGKFVRSFGDGAASISPWWDSRYWKRGKHTLTFKAEDEAGNKTSKTITVYKVKQAPEGQDRRPRSRSSSSTPRTVKVTGGVTPRTAHAATKLRGKAFVVFQKQAGRKWKTAQGPHAAPAGRCAVTKRSSRGTLARVPELPGRQGLQEVALQAGPLHDRLARSGMSAATSVPRSGPGSRSGAGRRGRRAGPRARRGRCRRAGRRRRRRRAPGSPACRRSTCARDRGAARRARASRRW